MRCSLLLLLLMFNLTVFAQLNYYADSFNGGVVTGGFSLGTSTFGTGNFTLNIPPGSTIRQAYFFGTSINTPGAYMVSLNGTNYTFDNTNLVQTFASGMGIASVHAIDITNAITPTTSAYSIQANFINQVSELYSEFYVYIAYENLGQLPVNTLVFINDKDVLTNQNFTLNTTIPMSVNVPIGLAFVGGYADKNNPTTDCQTLSVNGTNLGSFYGADNNAASDMGSISSFSYNDIVLNGIGDDNSNQAINGADVLSNIQGIISNNSTSITVNSSHCTPGNTDNLIWMFLLTYGNDTCSQRIVGLGNDTVFCNGSPLDLTTNFGTNATHTWSTGATDTSITVTSAGTYTVSVQLNNCTYTDTIVVQQSPPPLLELGNDTSICAGTSITLDASKGAGHGNSLDYLWNNGKSSALNTITNAGIYTVTISDNGCINSDSIQIELIPFPSLSLPLDTVVCNREAIQINLPESFDYNWSDNTNNKIKEISLPGNYQVIAQNVCGIDTSSFVVSFEECNCTLYVPNTFSPNNDGINDIFHPISDCDFLGYNLIVYNRWGQIVFETKNIKEGWDGQLNSQTQNKGIYAYYIYYVSPFTKKSSEKIGKLFLLDE